MQAPVQGGEDGSLREGGKWAGHPRSIRGMGKDLPLLCGLQKGQPCQRTVGRGGGA